MLKKDILDLINSFEAETWKYKSNDNNLDNDMQYIYSVENEIKKVNEENLKPLYDRYEKGFRPRASARKPLKGSEAIYCRKFVKMMYNNKPSEAVCNEKVKSRTV